MKLRHLDKSDPTKKKADDLRKDSKNVNFAAQFGGQAVKLSETLIMSVEDAQLFLDARSAMFPEVDEAAIRAEDYCKKYGYALTMMGARRHLREAMISDDRWAASRAARQAWNMEIQGSAAEMTKLAMARLWKSGAIHKYDVRFIAPIHDELVTSVHRDHALEFIKIKHACMTAQYADMSNPNDPNSVPIMGSISIGPNFADQIECGDWYIEENIREALDKIFHKEVA
jgi:DNA polymerase-1